MGWRRSRRIRRPKRPRRCGARCAARRPIDETLDAANADAFVALLTGVAIGAPVPVTVLRLGSRDEIAGYGPISPGHAAKLRAGVPVIDLTVPPGPSTGYRPHPTWPDGCGRPTGTAGSRDADGQPFSATSTMLLPTRRATIADNLAPLCRYHHR